MKHARPHRRIWLQAILTLTLVITAVDSVTAETLLWAVTSNPGCGVNIANAVAVDGAGLYVVGFETHPYGVPLEPHARQWRVEKRNLVDGSLVWASAPPDRSTLPSEASGVAVDGSGVYVAGSDGSHGLDDFEWRIEKRIPADGSPMWTVTSNPSPGNDEAYGAALDGSGLYVVGSEFTSGSFGWRIEKRSLSDGLLIWNVTSHPREENQAWAVAVDDSGIYVVGESKAPEGGAEWRIEKRRLTDGSLIWNATSHPSGGGRDSASSVALDATGVYVAGAQQLATAGFEWRVEKRRLTDGSPIWNATSDPTPDNWAWDVAVDASGIYMTGYDRSPDDDEEWRVEKRSLADGSLVWNATSNPSSKMDEAKGVAVDASGVYVVGFDQSPDNFQWRIEKRSLTDGSLVWTATSNPGTGVDEATAIAVDGSAFYVVGYDSYWLGAFDLHSRWRIEKRSLTDGSLMWTRTSNPSYLADRPWALAVDNTGVYVVGYQEYSAGNPPRWRIEKRSLGDGSLTWTQVLTDPDIHGSEARGVAVDGSGVYAVGFQESLWGPEWRVEKRRLTDGTLIWNVTSSPSDDDVAFGVALDGSGMYVVGADVVPGNPEWRMEKRRLDDGSLIWNVTSNPGPGEDVPASVAVDGSAIYVVGIDETASGPWEWRAEKRRLIDGSLIWNVTSNPSLGDDLASGVAVDGSGVYVVGSDESQGPDNFQWRIEKRSLADGSLMWNATSKPTSGAAEAHAVAADASGIYVAGYDSSTSSDIHEWRIEKREVGPPMPPPGPNVGGLLLIVAAVPVGIAALATAAVLSKRAVHTAGLPRGTGRRPPMVCPRCHRPLGYHALYHRWYCSSCMRYI